MSPGPGDPLTTPADASSLAASGSHKLQQLGGGRAPPKQTPLTTPQPLHPGSSPAPQDAAALRVWGPHLPGEGLEAPTLWAGAAQQSPLCAANINYLLTTLRAVMISQLLAAVSRNLPKVSLGGRILPPGWRGEPGPGSMCIRTRPRDSKGKRGPAAPNRGQNLGSSGWGRGAWVRGGSSGKTAPSGSGCPVFVG